jgi:hypothetical protein
MTTDKDLIDAIQNVAEVAREIEEDAMRDSRGNWTISADDMHQLRAALGAWRRASDDFLASIHEGNKTGE